MDDELRINNALRDGYLVATPAQFDRLDGDTPLRLYAIAAEQFGFPMVVVVPKDRTEEIHVAIAEFTPDSRRTRRRAETLLRRRTATGSTKPKPRVKRVPGTAPGFSWLTAGPFRAGEARRTAGELARLTGVEFPLSALLDDDTQEGE